MLSSARSVAPTAAVPSRAGGGLQSLRQWLRGRQGAATPEQLGSLLESVLKALVERHAGRGGPHGAVCPDTICLPCGGEASDAVLLEPEPPPAMEDYAAPEQRAGAAIAASDLFGLGLSVLYVGTGLEPAALRGRRGQAALRRFLGQLDPVTRQVVVKLVEPGLAQRYRSAAQALVLLRRRPRPVVPSAPPPPSVVPRARRSGAWMGAFLVLWLCAMAAGFAWGVYEREIGERLPVLGELWSAGGGAS